MKLREKADGRRSRDSKPHERKKMLKTSGSGSNSSNTSSGNPVWKWPLFEEIRRKKKTWRDVKMLFVLLGVFYFFFIYLLFFSSDTFPSTGICIGFSFKISSHPIFSLNFFNSGSLTCYNRNPWNLSLIKYFVLVGFKSEISAYTRENVIWTVNRTRNHKRQGRWGI